MIHEYKTARSICGFVEFVAWAGVVIAALLALMSVGTASSGRGGAVALVALLPALWLALGCFLIIIIVQMARATMDGSVASQIMVQDTRKHHEELMRSFKQLAASAAPISDAAAKSIPTSTPDTAPKRQEMPEAREFSTPPSLGKTVEYKGVTITQEAPYRFVALGKTFDKVADAEVYIDFNSNARQHEKVVDAIGAFEAQPGAVAPVSTSVVKFRGHEIVRDGGAFLVHGRRFDTIGLAQNRISDLVDGAVMRR